MAYEVAKCPSCDAKIQVPNDLESVTCDYCGSNIKTKAAISYAKVQIEGEVQVKGIIDIEHLLDNAKTNIMFNRPEKALNIYTDITNTYPSDWRAWYGILNIMSDNFDKPISALDTDKFYQILRNILLLDITDAKAKNICQKSLKIVNEYNKLVGNIYEFIDEKSKIRNEISLNESKIAKMNGESSPSGWLILLWFSLLFVPFIVFNILSAGYWDNVLITLFIITIAAVVLGIVCTIAWGMKVKSINRKMKELEDEIRNFHDIIKNFNTQIDEHKNMLDDVKTMYMQIQD